MADIPGVERKKIKLWDYQEAMTIHEHFEVVHEKINALGFVPDGF